MRVKRASLPAVLTPTPGAVRRERSGACICLGGNDLLPSNVPPGANVYHPSLQTCHCRGIRSSFSTQTHPTAPIRTQLLCIAGRTLGSKGQRGRAAGHARMNAPRRSGVRSDGGD